MPNVIRSLDLVTPDMEFEEAHELAKGVGGMQMLLEWWKNAVISGERTPHLLRTPDGSCLVTVVSSHKDVPPMPWVGFRGPGAYERAKRFMDTQRLIDQIIGGKVDAALTGFTALLLVNTLNLDIKGSDKLGPDEALAMYPENGLPVLVCVRNREWGVFSGEKRRELMEEWLAI